MLSPYLVEMKMTIDKIINYFRLVALREVIEVTNVKGLASHENINYFREKIISKTISLFHDFPLLQHIDLTYYLA